MAAGLLLIVTIGTGGSDDDGPAAEPSPQRPARIAPAAGLPAPIDRPNLPDGDALDRWSHRIANTTDLPAWAAEAYGRAEMWTRSEAPDCMLSWSTLAALSRVESGDGPLKPLAVTPDVWQRWGARATRDGAPPDPKDVHDAALTAARFLCDAGGDLSTGNGWWRGMLAYDPSKEQAQKVLAGAHRYAVESLRAPVTG